MTKKIVFLGNSIVNGFPFGRTKSFPGLLRKKLKAAGEDYSIVNCGVNGETSAQMIARFDEDVIKRCPEYVFISCGVNDFIYRENSPTEVIANLNKMYRMADAAGIKTIIMTSPHLHAEMAKRIWLVGCGIDYYEVNSQISEYRELIILEGFKYFDLNKAYADFGEYYDGLHPTEAGYEYIADKLAEWIPANIN